MPAEAPPAPAAPPIQITQAPPIKSGLPNGAGIIEVPATGVIDTGPSTPPKKGSARQKMMDDLQKKVKPGTAITPTEPPAERPGAPAEVPDPEAPAEPPPENPPAQPGEKPAEAPTPTAADPKGKGKPNPWKMFEAEKAARAKAEQELQEVRKSIVPEAERKALTERVEKAEARTKELEEHIRFVDYEKSSEYIEKYDKPYKQAWSRALSELKELTVTLGDNSTRPLQAEDMLELVNMTLPNAIQTAKQVFGDAADYVLAHRKEIRSIFDAQKAALDEARKNGGEHQTKQVESAKKWHAETTASIRQAWDKENASVLEHPEQGAYFKPKEGDEDWNQALAKGFTMADRAFSENPMDPKLSAEERAAIVKRHAAIRNRAAGWGPLRKYAKKLEARIAEMEKELTGYKNSGPGAGGAGPRPANGQPLSARDRMMADLEKIAKPL